MSDIVTTLQRSLASVLKPCGWLYGRAMRAREKFYRAGVMSSWTPSVPTVSVGNIGWGGTGKTPVADWLLGWAGRKGVKAVLLTRGYRARPGSVPYVVPSGAMAEEAGDEPLMLARNHPEARIIVDPVRKRAGRMAEETYHPGLIVLDDGFQHMAVKRHVNLALLRPEDVTRDWGRVIPAGSWREPASALGRADAFMIKVSPERFKQLRPLLDQRLGLLFRPIFSFTLVPTGLRQVIGGNTARDFGGGQYLLVSGVGQPDQVEATATSYFGFAPARHMVFKDHHGYTKNDVLRIIRTADQAGCKGIVCTPKDAVKLGPLCSEAFWQFDLRVEFGPSSLGRHETFATWWENRFKAIQGRMAGHGGNG